MKSVLSCLAIVLFIIAEVTAYLGPNRWLLISAIASFFLGVVASFFLEIDGNQIFVNIICGLVSMFIIVSSGIILRYLNNHTIIDFIISTINILRRL
jgi:hypothetical protein